MPDHVFSPVTFRPRLWLFLAVFAGSIVGCSRSNEKVDAGPQANATQPKAILTKLISPAPQTVLPDKPIDLIFQNEKPVTLAVNRKPHDWEPFARPLWVARLALPPGRNTLSLDGKRIDVYVEKSPSDPAAPSDWKPLGFHPTDDLGPSRCKSCHQTTTRDQKVTVGPPEASKNCLVCHDPAEFELVHEHPLEPLADCALCHQMHGAAEPFLLQGPRKEICAGCHEPDRKPGENSQPQ